MASSKRGLKVKASISLAGFEDLAAGMPATVDRNIETFSRQVMATAKRLVGKHRKPRKKNFYGPRGRKYVIEIKKRPSSKKVITQWKAGSYITRTMAIEKQKKGVWLIGPKAGWDPIKVLEHGGYERMYSAQLYTRKPRKSRKKNLKRGERRWTPQGNPTWLYSNTSTAPWLPHNVGKSAKSRGLKGYIRNQRTAAKREKVPIPAYGTMRTSLNVKRAHLAKQVARGIEKQLAKDALAKASASLVVLE